MKILVVCDQGNNRSVTLAGQLKYLGNDVLSAGISTNSEGTLAWLARFAEAIILTAHDQRAPFKKAIEAEYKAAIEREDPCAPAYAWERHRMKVEVWDIGPDVYKRPFNKQLLAIVKRLIKEHPEVDNRPK